MMAGTSLSYGEIPHMAIGYTGESLPNSSSYGIGEAGVIKAATLVDPSELGDLDNLKITGFNVGLASRINVGSLTLWASESLDGEPLGTFEIDGKPSKGWNEIVLSDYIDIPCKPLYIGYTIVTSGASYPVAVAGSPYPGGFWIDNGNGWTDMSEEAQGMLGMSVVITADNLPRYNLTLVNADIPSVMHSSVPTEIPLEIRNSGSMTVSGFSVTCQEGEKEQTFDFSSVIKPNERLKLVLDVLPLSEESETPFEFKITISSIDDGEDTNPDDNSVSAMTRVSRFTFTKRLLVEEFTTMACVNCPRAAKLLHQALSKNEYKDKVFGVCHHSGYYTDFLTQPCDEEMLVLYGGEGSYAPAMCLDRLEMNEGSVAMSFPLGVDDLTSLFDYVLATPAEVDLNVNARWNSSTGEIDVEVEGGSASGAPDIKNNRITVYVLQNDINTPMQSGGDADYMQQHVIRAYNATWGKDIEWDEKGQFEYKVSLNLPSNIVPEDMEVVGVISHYNPDDALDCAVGNSARAPRIDWSEWSGVSRSQEERVIDETYYDIFGNRVTDSHRGIVIKVQRLSDGKANVVKTICK